MDALLRGDTLMPLTVQPYPGELGSLGQILPGAFETLGIPGAVEPWFADGELELTGPFPVYTIDPDAIEELSDAVDPRRLVQTGWRAPISRNNEAVALVEVTIGEQGEEFISVRNREAAQALKTLLRIAVRYDESPKPIDVRWLSVPDIYVSALWLSGERDLFLPTRLGTADRVDPQELGWSELRKLMLPLIDAARPSAAILDLNEGSPRSGFPR